MSRHQAETVIFEILRASERNPNFHVSEYTTELSGTLRDAIERCDVPYLARLGVHPCLLIVFALAMNVQRPAFINQLPPVTLSKEKPRWRS